MYKHRTYVEKSNDFEKMIELVTRLNAIHICDWSVGRIYAWRYGRWDTKSQDDLQFEKQAELYFDKADKLQGIIITENFGREYYLLSEKKEEIIQNMIDFLLKNQFGEEYSVIVSECDVMQQSILFKNGFAFQTDADVTYTYSKDKIAFPDISLPDGFTLSDQEKFKNMTAVEKQRFFSFNPNSEYSDVIDKGYKHCRTNPLLIQALNIVLLDSNNTPISSCVGYLDKDNSLMEIEVVATKSGYENRGFAKIVICECIRKGIDFGVVEFSISGWNEKTKRIYSSFGEPTITKKFRFAR